MVARASLTCHEFASNQAQKLRHPAHCFLYLPCCSFTKLATLEFDRDRKSMSVIAATTGAVPAASGVTTRSQRSATGPGRQQNVLLVKGAAECVLSRCSKVGRMQSSEVITGTVPCPRASAACTATNREDLGSNVASSGSWWPCRLLLLYVVQISACDCVVCVFCTILKHRCSKWHSSPAAISTEP